MAHFTLYAWSQIFSMFSNFTYKSRLKDTSLSLALDVVHEVERALEVVTPKIAVI